MYLVASTLLYPLGENHKCLPKSIREKSFPAIYDNLRKYASFNAAKEYMTDFQNDSIDPKLLERNKMVQLNLSGFIGSYSPMYKDFIKW